MFKKYTPPEYGDSSGPIIVACQWKRSSPTGPAEQFAGGSRPRSCVDNGARYDGGRVRRGGGVGASLRAVAMARRMYRPSSRAAAVACRGTGGLFKKVAAGMVFRAFVPMKASGRENSMPISCIGGAKLAAAVAGAPRRLTPRLRPGRPPSRYSFFAPARAPSSNFSTLA